MNPIILFGTDASTWAVTCSSIIRTRLPSIRNGNIPTRFVKYNFSPHFIKLRKVFRSFGQIFRRKKALE